MLAHIIRISLFRLNRVTRFVSFCDGVHCNDISLSVPQTRSYFHLPQTESQLSFWTFFSDLSHWNGIQVNFEFRLKLKIKQESRSLLQERMHFHLEKRTSATWCSMGSLAIVNVTTTTFDRLRILFWKYL